MPRLTLVSSQGSGVSNTSMPNIQDPAAIRSDWVLVKVTKNYMSFSNKPHS